MLYKLKYQRVKIIQQTLNNLKIEQALENFRNGNSSKKEANSTPKLPSTLIKVGTITDNDIKKAETERQTRVTGPINTEISKADTTSTSGSSSSMKKADSITSPRSTGSGAQKSSTAITQQKKSTTETNTATRQQKSTTTNNSATQQRRSTTATNTATQQRKSTTNTATQQRKSTTKSATQKRSVLTTSSSSSQSRKSAATVRKRR